MVDSNLPQDMLAVLHAASAGDAIAASQLLPLLYHELRSLARARRASLGQGQTLQTTELVHEAYLKIVGGRDTSWASRRHFFAAAGNAMRQVLVDQARRKHAIKRGGDRKRSDLSDIELPFETPSIDLLALDEALTDLERQDPRKVRLVTLHFFAGLSLPEVAEALELSLSTIEREWRFTRALLHTRLAGDAADASDRPSQSS